MTNQSRSVRRERLRGVFLGKNAFSSQLPVQSSLCVQIDYSFAIFISKRTKVEGAEGVDCSQSVVAGI